MQISFADSANRVVKGLFPMGFPHAKRVKTLEIMEIVDLHPLSEPKLILNSRLLTR